MSRPNNRVVVRHGVIFSISPKNLREFLQGGAFIAKEIGMPEADVSDLSGGTAETLLHALKLTESSTVKVTIENPDETATTASEVEAA